MTSQKIIAQGAEAIIYKKDNIIIKNRVKKSYRIPELDEKIRKRRTRSEAKLLTKASKIINCPIPEINKEKNSTKLIMPFINGKKLSEHLDDFSLKEQKQICKKIGESIAKLHNADIIHGDLTTSNMIYAPTKKNSVFSKGGDESEPIIFLIDFGLGFFNGKYEDKAVDLHLLKQALEAKHFEHWETLWKKIKEGYKNYKEHKIVFERLKAVEKRGRYKS